jgi:transcriptional regulator with XRE-family HTH domain
MVLEVPRQPPPEGHLLYLLGAIIHQHRVRRGLTQEDLATLLGLSHRTVRQYERGLRNPGIQQLWKLARACDLPLSLFLAPLDNAKVIDDEPDDEDDGGSEGSDLHGDAHLE